MKDSMAFGVHKNSVNEIQHEISPTLFIIEAQKKEDRVVTRSSSNLQI